LRCLRVVGTIPFSVVGVLASLTTPVAKARISVFAVSTFDTDYLLVKEQDLGAAVDALRRQGCSMYNHSLRETSMKLSEVVESARLFVEDWTFYRIIRVKITERPAANNCGADWIVNEAAGTAKIEIGTEAQIECFTHEVFHSVTHASPLHQGADETWGDAWCDAFRYFHDAEFREKIDRYCALSYDQAKVYGDWNSDKAYAYPCSLIINKCGKDLGRLRELWLNLCNGRRQKKKDVLDDYFLYDMKNGTPKQPVS
jgi:hypothetical protein